MAPNGKNKKSFRFLSRGFGLQGFMASGFGGSRASGFRELHSDTD